MRTQMCFLELPQNNVPLFLSDFVNMYQSTSEYQITINSRDKINTFSLGGAVFSVVALVFVAKE